VEIGETIYFWSEEPPYADFTNSALSKFELDGETWPTVEHYLQASKFNDAKRQEEIRLSKTVEEAVKKGYGKGITYSDDFYRDYPVLLKKAVQAKITQNAEIRRLLEATGTKKLVHISRRPHGTDERWDTMVSNKNILGLALMEIRDGLSK
jgi:ribA/ribD-fused uncharacterized protein